VMHYHSQAFAPDSEKFTMEAHNDHQDTLKMGNVGSLSPGDVARIRAMYNCDGDRPEQDFTGVEEDMKPEELTTESNNEFQELPTASGEVEELTTERIRNYRHRHSTTRRPVAV
jgi:Astacin (Peptidase family M12A)